MADTKVVSAPPWSEDAADTNNGRRPEDDPRFQRIRAKLTKAILTLASEKPAEQISVSELTGAAGVSRTTFYKHSDSPAAFLADYLIAQLQPRLDPIAHLLDDTGPGYLLRWRDIHLDLLEHVSRNRRVYDHVFSSSGQSVVLSMISAYFEEIFGEFVRDFARHVDGPPPAEIWLVMASSQQVHNTIAMISSWLRTEMQDSPEDVIAAYVTLVPPWQIARFSETGRTTLRTAPHPRPLEILGMLDEQEEPETREEAKLRLSLSNRERMVLGTTSRKRTGPDSPRTGDRE